MAKAELTKAVPYFIRTSIVRSSKTFKLVSLKLKLPSKYSMKSGQATQAMAGLGLEFIKLLFKVRNKILRIISKLLSTFKKVFVKGVGSEHFLHDIFYKL